MKFQKERMFTAINADKAKAGSKGYFADNLAVLEAKVEQGEILELKKILGKNEDRRFRVSAENASITLEYAFFYLVEEPEEEKYRPYETTDEMIEDFRERAKAYGANFFKCPMFNPTIWVKDKKSNSKYLISAFGETNVLIGGKYLSSEMLFEDFTYLDGTPCGKKLKKI